MRKQRTAKLNHVADEIVRAYGAGESMEAIGREYGAGGWAVRTVLTRRGVTVRGRFGIWQRQPAAAHLLQDAALLRRLYVDEVKSLETVAAELGCAVQTLRKAMQKAGVPIRPMGGTKHSAAARRRPTAARRISRHHKRKLKDRAGDCAICTTSEDLQIHHRDADRANDAPENVVVLCRDCHSIAEWLIEPVERRLRGGSTTSLSIPPERNPGWRQSPVSSC